MAGLLPDGSAVHDVEDAEAAEAMVGLRMVSPVPAVPGSFPPVATPRGQVRMDDSIDLLMQEQLGTGTPVRSASVSASRRRSEAAESTRRRPQRPKSPIPPEVEHLGSPGHTSSVLAGKTDKEAVSSLKSSGRSSSPGVSAELEARADQRIREPSRRLLR